MTTGLVHSNPVTITSTPQNGESVRTNSINFIDKILFDWNFNEISTNLEMWVPIEWFVGTQRAYAPVSSEVGRTHYFFGTWAKRVRDFRTRLNSVKEMFVMCEQQSLGRHILWPFWQRIAIWTLFFTYHFSDSSFVILHADKQTYFSEFLDEFTWKIAPDAPSWEAHE